MIKFNEKMLNAAHKHSIFHIEEIMKSEICGCFYCLNNYRPDKTLELVDEDDSRGKTALCPKCNIDVVLGSESGYPVADKYFLQAMYKYYF